MSRTDSRYKEWDSVRKRPYCHELPRLDDSLWPMFQAYLLGRGLPWRLARQNGWYPSSEAGDTSPRIVMPGTSSDPRNLFWQARDMWGDVLKRYQSPYAARGDSIIVTWPTEALGGYSRHLDGLGSGNAPACVLEGPMDALAASEWGFVGIAMLSNTPPEEALELMSKLTLRKHCLFVADNDSPQVMANLVAYFANRGVASARLLIPSPYKDLGEMPRQERGRFLHG